MSADSNTERPLNGRQILARLAPSDGVGSGLDTDLVRGRAMPTSAFRLDFAPAFVGPFFGAEIPAASIFGV